jgi:hypothetical protein
MQAPHRSLALLCTWTLPALGMLAAAAWSLTGQGPRGPREFLLWPGWALLSGPFLLGVMARRSLPETMALGGAYGLLCASVGGLLAAHRADALIFGCPVGAALGAGVGLLVYDARNLRETRSLDAAGQVIAGAAALLALEGLALLAGGLVRAGGLQGGVWPAGGLLLAAAGLIGALASGDRRWIAALRGVEAGETPGLRLVLVEGAARFPSVDLASTPVLSPALEPIGSHRWWKAHFGEGSAARAGHDRVLLAVGDDQGGGGFRGSGEGAAAIGLVPAGFGAWWLARRRTAAIVAMVGAVALGGGVAGGLACAAGVLILICTAGANMY